MSQIVDPKKQLRALEPLASGEEVTYSYLAQVSFIVSTKRPPPIPSVRLNHTIITLPTPTPTQMQSKKNKNRCTPPAGTGGSSSSSPSTSTAAARAARWVRSGHFR